MPAGATDSLQLVLEAMQRVIQLEGNPGDHLLQVSADRFMLAAKFVVEGWGPDTLV